MKNYIKYLERSAAFVAAVILLQTLYFKFSAHPDSVMLFTELGLEPWGRVGLGVVELITASLLLWKRFAFIGASISMGIMAGAIGSHVFVIGMDFNDDGGGLFTMACITFFCSAVVARLNFKDWKLKSYVS